MTALIGKVQQLCLFFQISLDCRNFLLDFLVVRLSVLALDCVQTSD
jgi:hypothetical protein